MFGNSDGGKPAPNGTRKHRRMVIGSVSTLPDEFSAREAVAALHLDMNPRDARVNGRMITVSELVDQYWQRELKPDTIWKTHSGICDRNPIRLVRQSAKRKTFPVVLEADQVQRLLAALDLRERTLVLLAFGTGLRKSELFGLKWLDINFHTKEIRVVRSVVFQVVGACKTEASQKSIPLDPYLAEALQRWREYTNFRSPDDWVFASPASRGRRPYWGEPIMARFIRPVVSQLLITKHIGWHTFRHTYLG
jgi:integrase